MRGRLPTLSTPTTTKKFTTTTTHQTQTNDEKISSGSTTSLATTTSTTANTTFTRATTPQNENNDESISSRSSTSLASTSSNQITSSITSSILTTTTSKIFENECDLSTTPFNILLQDPNDCNKFYMCTVTVSEEVVKHELSCPPTLLFNEEVQVCDWPVNVICKSGS